MQLSLWQSLPSGTREGKSTRTTLRPPAAQPVARPSPEATATLERLTARAKRYELQAHTPGTRATYQTDWDAFQRWCLATGQRALPASSTTLCLYLTHLAESGRKVATIRNARKAIGLAHVHAGLPRPDRDGRARMLARGIALEHGSREEGVDPLLEDDLARCVSALGHTVLDVRDRAILLLGWAGALRASDLARLDVQHLRFARTSVRVLLTRTKGDRLGVGTYAEVPAGTKQATCPLRALEAWLERVGRKTGPLFTSVHGITVSDQRISTRAVARAVQRAVKRAGLEGHYAAHSLRSGLATSAYAHGCTEREIQVHGRWKDRRSLDRYIQIERVSGRKNVADGLL